MSNGHENTFEKLGEVTDNDQRLGYTAVHLGPETSMRHKPHAELKMAAEPKP